MANIINIETSGKICSVALTKDGVVELDLQDDAGMRHAEKLAPFVEKCMKELKRKDEKLDAVAVSIGPGSYTGLRIGLSLAKGLAFAANVPLIGIDTLKILAVKAMFRNFDFEGTEIFVPMIDARRMEVFTGALDFRLNYVVEKGPLILNEDSFTELLKNNKLIFIGDGAEKAKGLIKNENAIWIDNLNPTAKDMLALSEKAYREGEFIDKAYSTPEYLKEYQTTTPKSKI